MIKVSMTWNGQPFSADRMVKDLKREMLAAAEKDLMAKAKQAAAGKGKLDIKVERTPSGEFKGLTLSGDAAAVEAAQKAIGST
ncbi:MAG TPA: hypothetical protein VE866_09770 [Candidatus Binatia bacterium]|jgi:hypothetical protein|nr:hypothetical protein [Candidatus Binatia bacterium]